MSELKQIGSVYFVHIPCSRFGAAGRIRHKVTVVGYIDYKGTLKEILEVEEDIVPNPDSKELTLYDEQFQSRKVC
jgi:hypothetical protein